MHAMDLRTGFDFSAVGEQRFVAKLTLGIVEDDGDELCPLSETNSSTTSFALETLSGVAGCV